MGYIWQHALFLIYESIFPPIPPLLPPPPLPPQASRVFCRSLGVESSPDPSERSSRRAAAYRSTSAVEQRGCHLSFFIAPLSLLPPRLFLPFLF